MAGDVDLGDSYLDKVAAEIKRLVPIEALPDEDTSGLFRIYAVLLLGMGGGVERRDVHNAWVAWMLGRDSEHEALVPFEELPAHTAAADDPFVGAIKAAADSLRRVDG